MNRQPSLGVGWARVYKELSDVPSTFFRCMKTFTLQGNNRVDVMSIMSGIQYEVSDF